MPSHAVRTAALLSVAALSMLAAPPTARSQGPAVDPAKAALIRRILELTNAAELAITAMEASIPGQRAATPQIPKEFWDEFVVRARSDMPRFIDMLIPIYDAHFTEAQLEQLVTFYQSPLGQHSAKVQPLVTTQSIQTGQQWGAQLGAEIAQDLAKRGIQMPRQ